MRSTPSARCGAAAAGAARVFDAGADGAAHGNAGAASNSSTILFQVLYVPCVRFYYPLSPDIQLPPFCPAPGWHTDA